MRDSAAWCQSRLAKQLESGALNMLLHFLIGDDAFAVSDRFLAPWPGQCFQWRKMRLTSILANDGRRLSAPSDSYSLAGGCYGATSNSLYVQAGP